MLSPFDQPLAGDLAAQQTMDNYNHDMLYRFRGTLSRIRRKAILSKDPQQLSNYLQLASVMGVDPGFSNTGRVSDRMARAQNKLQTDRQTASVFQSPMAWFGMGTQSAIPTTNALNPYYSNYLNPYYLRPFNNPPDTTYP